MPNREQKRGEQSPFQKKLVLIPYLTEVEEEAKNTLKALMEKRKTDTWVLTDEIDLTSAQEKLNLTRKIKFILDLLNLRI